MFDSVVHHIGFQMAAGPGVDLENGNIQCGNAVGIIRSLLVSLDDIQREFAFQAAHGFLQQRSLSGTGRTHQVQAEDFLCLKITAVALRQQIVPPEYILFKSYYLILIVMVMMMFMAMFMIMVVFVMMMVFSTPASSTHKRFVFII